MKLIQELRLGASTPQAIGICMLAALASACGGGNDIPGNGERQGVNEAARRTWHDVYGAVCGVNVYPSPGCNFYDDGSKIDVADDPFRNASEYREFDCAPNCQYGGDGQWEGMFQLVNRYWVYTDPYGVERGYTGFGWMSPTGVIYDGNGTALNESAEEEGRDLMASIASVEKLVVDRAASRLSSEFALSSATGQRIATTLHDWATLGRKHGRTDRDLADFSERLYGVKLDRAKSLLTRFAAQGDQGALETLNREVATAWGADPETSRTVLLSWYGRSYLQRQR